MRKTFLIVLAILAASCGKPVDSRGSTVTVINTPPAESDPYEVDLDSNEEFTAGPEGALVTISDSVVAIYGEFIEGETVIVSIAGGELRCRYESSGMYVPLEARKVNCKSWLGSEVDITGPVRLGPGKKIKISIPEGGVGAVETRLVVVDGAGY